MGQSERTAVTSGATTTSFLSGPLGLDKSTTSTGSTYVVRDPAGNLIGFVDSAGTHSYFLLDGHGSVVAITNGAGSTVGHRYGYDEYGKTTSSSGTTAQPWGYAGGYTDATGLIKFGTRYYDPTLGRWTQPDPVAGGIASPSTLNRYAYAGGDPINVSDPTGRSFDFLGYLASSFVGFGLGTDVYLAGGFLLTGVLAPEILGFVAFGLVGATIFAGVTYALSTVTGF